MSIYDELNMAYAEEDRISKEFYDTIDFTKFMSDAKRINIRDLINCIEEYYDINHPDLIPEELNRCFFNFTSDEEFADYLCERYGWKTQVEYVENCYVLR